MTMRSLLALILLLALFTTAEAWTTREVSRRIIFVQAVGAVTAARTLPALAIDASMLDELKSSMAKLEPIPDLLEQKEWDKVRSILKLPPVNKLWNLGDVSIVTFGHSGHTMRAILTISLSVAQSQNTILRLAKDTGNVELFELKDDLAYNLQMCDQLTYDNAFVYYQPGSGKYKIKEPQDLARRAIGQIQQAIDMASE